MDTRRNILWVDGLAGLCVGFFILLLQNWLHAWYGLPHPVVVVIGIANLAYGLYSTVLARREERPYKCILLLIFANSAWVFVCIAILVNYAHSLKLLGWLQVGGEALFVGTLAFLEWRWRAVL